MPETILFTLILTVSCLGFALLALSQAKHWQSVTGQRDVPPGRTVILRLAGYGLLALALGVAVQRDGPGFGSVFWAMGLSASALIVVALLTWRPYWLKPLACLAAAGCSCRQSA